MCHKGTNVIAVRVCGFTLSNSKVLRAQKRSCGLAGASHASPARLVCAKGVTSLSCLFPLRLNIITLFNKTWTAAPTRPAPRRFPPPACGHFDPKSMRRYHGLLSTKKGTKIKRQTGLPSSCNCYVTSPSSHTHTDNPVSLAVLAWLSLHHCTLNADVLHVQYCDPCGFLLFYLITREYEELEIENPEASRM